jgi:hypothetical protein
MAEMADSVQAAHHGKFALTGEMRATGQLLIDRLQRSGMNMHDDFHIAGDRFRGLLVSRRFPK